MGVQDSLVDNQDNQVPQMRPYVEMDVVHQDNQGAQIVDSQGNLGGMMDSQEHQDNQGRLVDQVKKDLLHKAL